MKITRLTNLIMYWLKIVPKWDRCTKASCWDGSNAQRRMMNILSPKFGDAKFKEYVAWMEGRGCNTAHLLYANHKDGEGGGYYVTDDAKLTTRRIKYLRKHGFAIVPWLMADDSRDYAATMFKNADAYVKSMADKGLFDHASFVCLGLEMDEYGTASDWAKVAAAVRKYLPRMKVATHHTSGHTDFAALGDIVCDQLSPGVATPARIRESVNRIRAMGKQAIGFEYDRHPNRERAEAALQAGAFGVGNW